MKDTIIEILKKRKNRNLLKIVAFMICGFMIWVLNKFTPMFGDDYNYSFIMGVYPWQRMTSITQLPLSMYNHFFMANCGKIFTNGLAQIFLMLPSYIFDVINSVAFLLMIMLVSYHVAGSIKKISIKFFLLAMFLLIIEVPSFAQSYLWIDGAANYLYGPAFVLFFLIPYRNKFEKKSGRDGIIKESIMAVFMLCMGVVAGWTNENLSVALSVMIIAFIVLYRFDSIKINVWNISGLIGAVTGLGFLLFGPGEQERLKLGGGTGNIIAWFKRFVFISLDLFEFMQLILMIITVVVIYMYVKKQKITNPLVWVYAIGFLASVYSMIASPVFPDRTWSGAFLLVIILLGLLIRGLVLEEREIKIVTGVYLLLITIGVAVYINGYFATKNAYVSYKERISIIEEAKQNGEKSVVIPIIRGKSRFIPYQYYGDITEDSEYWLNHAIAQYYGFDEVIGE